MFLQAHVQHAFDKHGSFARVHFLAQSQLKPVTKSIEAWEGNYYAVSDKLLHFVHSHSNRANGMAWNAWIAVWCTPHDLALLINDETANSIGTCKRMKEICDQRGHIGFWVD